MYTANLSINMMKDADDFAVADTIKKKLISKTVNSDGTYIAKHDDADGYSDVIVDVPTGEVVRKDVNFYDYDGMRLYSYTKEEFLEMDSYPENPVHEGLTAQGWNWSFDNAKTYVRAYGLVNIGQMYITDDGKTRYYISLVNDRLSPLLKLYLNENTEVNVDWGDGSPVTNWTTTDAGYKEERHTYPEMGDYVLSIEVVSGSISLKPTTNPAMGIISDGKNGHETSNMAYYSAVRKIELGADIANIDSQAFMCYQSLVTITIPDNISFMGTTAFSTCNRLTSIVLPKGLTSVENTVFSGCNALAMCIFPDTITSIGENAFQECFRLSDITIPESTTTLYGTAFDDCKALFSIIIPDSVQTLYYQLFQFCRALTYVKFPSTVSDMGTKIFYMCGLESFDYPKGVGVVKDSFFYNCTSLRSVTLPDDIKTIDTAAFSYAKSLATIDIPEGVTTIGGFAFQYCYSLYTLTIPSTVTSIGQSAFKDCTGIDHFKFAGSVPPTIANSNVWTNVPNTALLYIPALYFSAYRSAQNYPNVYTIRYVGYGTYADGEVLPTQTIDGTRTLTWYATIDDWRNRTNPITVGNGNEVYARTNPD